MALVDCPDCGNQISTEAYVCPKCGRPTGRQPAPLRPFDLRRTVILWIILIIVFLVIWRFLGGGHSQPT